MFGEVLMLRSRVPLFVLISLVAACDTGTDVNAWDGQDSFSSNTLSEYALLSREGRADVWTIDGGWLIARAEGDAVNAGMIRQSAFMTDGRVEFESDHLTNGGLRFRVQDADSYYLLQVRDDAASYFNMQIRNFELYLFHDGAWTTLARHDLDIPRGTRFTAAVEFVGPVLSLYLNGTLVDAVQEATLQGAGRIGLEHDDVLTPGEESRYDVFRWKALD